MGWREPRPASLPPLPSRSLLGAPPDTIACLALCSWQPSFYPKCNMSECWSQILGVMGDDYELECQ